MRTRSGRGRARLALAILALATGAGNASAQVLGAPVPITLNVNQASTLSVIVQSGAVQTLNSPTLSNAITNFPAPVQILTQWDFRPNTVTGLSLVAFFATPSTAISGPNGSIPSSRIEGRISGGVGPATAIPTIWTAFTSSGSANNGVPGGSLTLWTFGITGNAAAVRKNQQTNQLDLRLNLSGFSLPSGTYAGTLVIRAYAQ